MRKEKRRLLSQAARGAREDSRRLEALQTAILKDFVT
jgi:hypothetical protein